MTLNLPLADVIRLKPPLPTSPRSPVPLPVRNPRRRFLGLAATCRIYRGVLPHLVVLLAAALARLVRPSPASYLPDTLFSYRSTILSRFTAYLSPILCSPSRELNPRYLSPSVLRSIYLSGGVAIPYLPILIYTRAIAYTYRLRPIRRR